MKITDYYTLYDYEIVDYLFEKVDNEVTEYFEVILFKKNDRKFEEVEISFELNALMEIEILDFTTYSHFDSERKKKPCGICNTFDIEKVSNEIDPNDDTYEYFIHQCDLDKENLKGFLNDVIHAELIDVYFPQERMDKEYKIESIDDENATYYIIDESFGTHFFIENEKVYHVHPFDRKEVRFCPFCSSMHKIINKEDGVKLMECAVLTKEIKHLFRLITNKRNHKAKIYYLDDYRN